jgi:hypothetical protein
MLLFRLAFRYVLRPVSRLLAYAPAYFDGN